MKPAKLLVTVCCLAGAVAGPARTNRVVLARTVHAEVPRRCGVPARWWPKSLMGRDFHTALYPYNDHASDAAWSSAARKVRFDNPELNALAAFADAVPVYHANRASPDEASGFAAWRTVAENFGPGEADAEIVRSNPRPDRPLVVGFGSKRAFASFGGRIEPDVADWRRWRAAHPNLLFCWTHIEWDNEVGLAHARLSRLKDPVRRAEVAAFFGEMPRDRYGRVALQRKYFDRKVALHCGDLDVTGVMFASLFTGHLAASFGARHLIAEVTNTSGGNGEYRWNLAPMFARGAARQFDLDWEWYQAAYMNGWVESDAERTAKTMRTDMVCVYPDAPDTKPYWRNGYGCGPDFGVSRSLLRRGLYFAYVNGANLVEVEEWPAQYQMWSATEGRTVLSPRGEDYVRFHAFTRRHPDRGAPYTPVAILVPVAQGYPTFGGSPWGKPAYGYTRGDHALDAVFFTLCPGFERDRAMKRGVETNLHNTPFAQMYDVLSPDAGQSPDELLSALASYRAVVIAGDYRDRSFEKTLTDYAAQGGCVLRLDGETVPVPAADALARLQTGLLAYPAVRRLFEDLQRRYCPVVVSGDCLYGLNRTTRGWWLWVFNNRGVTKFGDTPERLDPVPSEVRVSLGSLRAASVRELLSEKTVPVANHAFAWTVGSGDLAVFEITE